MNTDNCIDFPVKLINISYIKQRPLNWVQAVPVQEKIPTKIPPPGRDGQRGSNGIQT